MLLPRSPVQKISVSRICHGGYPSRFTYGPKMINRSGSGLTGRKRLDVVSVAPFSVPGVDWDGCDVISLISASMSSRLMSAGDSLPFCDISVRVLVRSTRVSRPSAADSNRIVSEPLDRFVADSESEGQYALW